TLSKHAVLRWKFMARNGVLLFLVWSSQLSAQLPAVSYQHLRRDFELFSSSFSSLFEDEYGFIWFGSLGGGGLYRYDGYNLKTFQTDPNNLKSSVASSIINDVQYGANGLLYIGTYFGISALDAKTGKIESFNNEYDLFSDVRMGITNTFLSDTIHDVLWIGTRYGLARMDPFDHSSFTVLHKEPNINPVKIPMDIWSIIHDPKEQERLWLGTSTGLFQYTINKDEFTRIKHPGAEADSVLIVIDLAWDENGMLWIAAYDGNVMGYNVTTGEWKIYPVRASSTVNSTTNEVFKIVPLGDGTAWISTRSIVGKMDLTTGKYESWEYDASRPDGLMPNGAFRDLLFDRHGKLLIASWRGIHSSRQTVAKPSERIKDIRVAITDVETSPVYENGPKPLIYSEEMVLRKDQRDVTFQYVLPNPLNASAVTFQYMLEGLDKDWITTDQRRVRYPKLGGGDYRFLVRARESTSQPWTETTSLGIQIPKRLAEYAVFWVVLGMVILGLAVALYKFLVSRAKKEERLKADFEHQVSEVQMQALRAQMNPHFLFNSLNSIKYFAISKSKDETAAYLSKFSLLVRSILNNSKSRTISLKDELDALQLYIEIEHLRLDGKFDYTVDIDSSIHVRQAQIPPMILQPYVENAIWHGLMHKEGRGMLLVQVKDMGHQIQCVIEDNGIGRAKSAEFRNARNDHKKSVGMQITSDRITLINRIYKIDTQVHVVDLTDKDGHAAGTRVVINVPLIRDEEE
ncbi:MAG TPA: histidine kinase, partial [Saprospiraceae bacterium]